MSIILKCVLKVTLEQTQECSEKDDLGDCVCKLFYMKIDEETKDLLFWKQRETWPE